MHGYNHSIKKVEDLVVALWVIRINILNLNYAITDCVY